MSRIVIFPHRMKGHFLLLAGLALSLYFSYHTIYGERSYGHLQALNSVAAQKAQDLSMIVEERAALERDVKMLRPETLSLDLLEERARSVLGYKRADEYLVFRN